MEVPFPVNLSVKIYLKTPLRVFLATTNFGKLIQEQLMTGPTHHTFEKIHHMVFMVPVIFPIPQFP